MAEAAGVVDSKPGRGATWTASSLRDALNRAEVDINRGDAAGFSSAIVGRSSIRISSDDLPSPASFRQMLPVSGGTASAESARADGQLA